MSGYTILRRILAAELQPSEKLVGMAAVVHMDAQSGQIRLKQQTLARECGYSQATVKRAINALVCAGIFSTKRTGRASILYAVTERECLRVDRSPVSYLIAHPRAIRRHKGSPKPWEMDIALSTKFEEEHKRLERRLRKEAAGGGEHGCPPISGE